MSEMLPTPAPSAAYRTIRELADDERPRERLLAHGPAVLSEADLVAIVLGSGLRGENVVDLARRILETMGGLPGLVRADARSFQRTRGLGPAKAAQLVAAIELGRRVQQVDPGERAAITTPEAVFALLGSRLLGKTREELYVLSLDTKGRLLGSAAAVAGGVRSVSMRMAEVFREPVVVEATSVIVAHNHPSGDSAPSRQDIDVTRDIVAAGELLGITVQDHVIIGQGRFVSLHREGLMGR